MRIEDIDFTPAWFCGRWDLGRWDLDRGFEVQVRVLSEDECLYLGTTWDSFMHDREDSNLGYVAYGDKLATYYDRFNRHMPVEIRKALLREI